MNVWRIRWEIIRTVLCTAVVHCHKHGRLQDFFRGGQIRASGDESPPAESKVGTPVWVWG